jgi:uncharacterized membrane protein YphA (DoxX/SURF4 family)
MKAKALQNINLTSWLLRLGLAFVFIYAGVSSLQHPLYWTGYLPHFLTQNIAALTLIKIFAIYELILAAWLLSGKYIRYAAALYALTLAGIVVATPSQLIITFRDIGLVCMALALAFDK